MRAATRLFLLPLTVVAVALATPLLIAEAANTAPGSLDLNAAARAVDRDYDACLIDDKAISVVITFGASGAVVGVQAPSPLAGTAVETCIAGKLAAVRVPAFSGPDVPVKKTIRRGLIHQPPPPNASLSLHAVEVNGVGSGSVRVVIKNTSPDEHSYVLHGARGSGAETSSIGGTAAGGTLSRTPVDLRWPAKCSAGSAEMRIQLRGPDSDPTPKLVRLTSSTCKVTFVAMENPVKHDKLTAAELAKRNVGRLYYRNPAIVSAPKTCGDKLVVRAELVNATPDAVHHAALRLPQAGLVADAGVTLNPGETRVVERAALFEGGDVPISVEGAHDAASSNPLDRTELMREYTTGILLITECSLSATLLPIP